MSGVALVGGAGVFLLTGAPASAVESTPSLASYFCILTVNYPHGSTHVSGTINVTATTTCPTAMSSIYIDVELQRTSPNPNTWFNGTGITTSGKTNASDNQATSCSQGPGTFRGWATTTIVPPPGYVLTGSPTDSKWGTAVGVACGLSKSTAAQGTTSDTVLVEYEPVAQSPIK